jgi:hypothetical protein
MEYSARQFTSRRKYGVPAPTISAQTISTYALLGLYSISGLAEWLECRKNRLPLTFDSVVTCQQMQLIPNRRRAHPFLVAQACRTSDDTCECKLWKRRPVLS